MYGNENYVDTNAAATAEIVYELLLELGFVFKEDDEISKEIGTCLYTSLVTDTGAFRHSNVTYRTLEIAAKLKKIGVNNTFIYQYCQYLYLNIKIINTYLNFILIYFL